MSLHSDLVCLSHLRWGFVYQRPNHLMTRWARERRVFFVEEPTVGPTGRAWLEINEVEPNLWVCTPRLPEGLTVDEAEATCAGLVGEMARERGIVHPLLWVYSPMMLPMAGGLGASTVVHDCMDELSGFLGAPAALGERERELFGRADLVFTGGHSLYEAKRTQHASVHAFPSSLDTVNRLYGWSLDSDQLAAHFARVAEPVGHARTSEEAVVSKVGRDLYEKFFKNYTRKQWGLDPSELDATVAARVPARLDRDDRYFTDTFQAMPCHGYTRLFENMLDHPRITLMLGADYRDVVRDVRFTQMIFTGPVDAYFDHRFGPLPYRSLDFRFETHDREVFQPAAVVNYPNDHAYTRCTEFKYLSGQKHPKTTVVYETPRETGDPYYPIPRPENAELYRRYKALADATPNVRFAGRLGTYRYYNMDQVVGQALATFDQIAPGHGQLVAGGAAE